MTTLRERMITSVFTVVEFIALPEKGFEGLGTKGKLFILIVLAVLYVSNLCLVMWASEKEEVRKRNKRVERKKRKQEAA